MIHMEMPIYISSACGNVIIRITKLGSCISNNLLSTSLDESLQDQEECQLPSMSHYSSFLGR